MISKISFFLGRVGPVNDDEDDVEEEIDEIMEKNKQKSFKNSFEILNAKLLDLSQARNRLSVSPVSFDDSESSNKLKMRGRFSISPVSLNDDKDDCLVRLFLNSLVSKHEFLFGDEMIKDKVCKIAFFLKTSFY